MPRSSDLIVICGRGVDTRRSFTGCGWDRRRLTKSGIAQMLRRRCRHPGVEQVHPHQFRHTFAHKWLSKGGAEVDLMRLAGWHSS